ncbi:hypothetical protein BCR43DRAFT_146236 [Syncephalastrum racemosum]|uniref:Uncharacterized protein n=1 Tax=Syncephalastrum racemosum TaxID=13706 RepID=A0A1X2HMP9_SYNRA|nr:hypothetical protein BCR43DRAFT_146236 [Syncephalastrum racemosum]
MEQEILKSIMYDTPSYNPATHGPVRHGRSSSMGSAVLARPAIAQQQQQQQQQAFSTEDRKVSPDLTTEQHLVDMTARVSLDDDHRRHTYSHMSRHGSQSYSFTPQQHQQQQQQQQQQSYHHHHHHLNKVPSNGSLHSSSAAMQRMASYGSLHHSPQSVVFNAPMTNQDSYHRAGTPDDDYDHPNIDRRNTPFAFQQHHPRASPPPNHNPSASSSSSTYRRPQRHSFVTGSDTWASPPPRQRHGSMGFTSSPVADIWKHQQQQPPHQHRLPRQSRSSINLCQQAGFRNSTPPPTGLEQPLVTGEMASAAVYNGYYPYNGAFQNPLGIPTPPPSSSPVHHKQSMPSPYQSYQASSQSTQPLMYL